MCSFLDSLIAIDCQDKMYKKTRNTHKQFPCQTTFNLRLLSLSAACMQHLRTSLTARESDDIDERLAEGNLTFKLQIQETEDAEG